MADYVDQSTGLPMYEEGGKTYLRNAQGYVVVPTNLAGEYVAAQGYVPATAAEVEQRRRIKEQEGLAGGAKGVAKAAAAHGFDAATAVVRVPLQLGAAAIGDEKALKELENLTGHKVMENLAGIASELTGQGTAEKGAREYKEATKAQYEAHPTATLVAGVAGDLAGGVGIGGLSKLGSGAASGLVRGAGRTVGMGAEGALYGANQAGETSYLEDSPLTSQKLMAGMGLGAAFGAGGGALLSGGSAALKAGRNKVDDIASKAFGPKAQRAAGKAGDEALESVAAKAMGQGSPPPAPGLGHALRDLFERGQAAVTGVDIKTLRKAGPFRWHKEALETRDLAFRRDEILEGAKSEFTEKLGAMARNSSDVMDEVRNVGMKRDHMAKLLADSTPEMVQKQQSVALQHLWKTQDDLAKFAAQPEVYGNATLIKNMQKMAAKLGKKIESGDAADAMSGLDELKRAQQAYRVKLGRSAVANGDAFVAQQSDVLGREFERMQEGIRQGLMDESVWGKAATAQKEINAAYEQFFQHKSIFEQRFLTRTGEKFGGRGIYEVDPSKVSSYLDKLGRQESALVDKHLRGYLDATERLTKAVGDSFELGDKAARVADVSSAARGIGETLKRADETVAVSNQLQQILEAKAEGTWIAGALGGMAGGPIGAGLGMLVGAISNPGRQLKAAWGLQNMMGKVDVAIGKNLDEFFAMAKRKAAPALSAGEKVIDASAKAGRLARRAALPGGLAVERFASEGQTRRLAYEQRRDQIATLIASPQRLAEVVQKHVEPVAAVSPGLATQLAMDMTRALMLAQEAAPAEKAVGGLVPKRDKAFVSQQEIDRFADSWEGITSPLSLLEDLRKGQLNYTKRDAVAQVYPDLFREMQVSALERMANVDHPMPLQQRTQLDLLLNLGGMGEPSVRPDFLRRQAERAQMQSNHDNQPAPGRRPVNLSGGAATLSQSLVT